MCKKMCKEADYTVKEMVQKLAELCMYLNEDYGIVDCNGDVICPWNLGVEFTRCSGCPYDSLNHGNQIEYVQSCWEKFFKKAIKKLEKKNEC